MKFQLYLLAALTSVLSCSFAPITSAQSVGQGRCHVQPYRNPAFATLKAHKAAGGIIVAEQDSLTRALQSFTPKAEVIAAYADAINRYRAALDSCVRIYCMPIPLSSEFYLPDTAATWSKSQAASLNRLFGQLSDGVTAVNAYGALAAHSDEPVYSRTDHHWAPLGAYYAAQAFAQAAGVPCMDISGYDRHAIPGYVGTMYKFSKDTAVRNAPEVFEYFVPRGIDYATTTVTYTLDKTRKHVTSQSEPKPIEFFKHYKNPSSAYLTFMGGDTNQTSVRTSTPGSRHVLILKDSYGNAVPPFLFGSFAEIHVVDCRYFTGNIIEFVRLHGITDVVFINNLGHVANPATARKYVEYLTQR